MNAKELKVLSSVQIDKDVNTSDRENDGVATNFLEVKK